MEVVVVNAAFVILHYNTLDETHKCINSIKQLTGAEKAKIVVVDNASPNNTGSILAEEYESDTMVDVLLRNENGGFSSGNNAGCEYAVQKYDPAFLIVVNNDVEFVQKDFLMEVSKEYENSAFDILGPDIINPIKKIHQSPISVNPPTKKQVDRTILFNQLSLAFYILLSSMIKKYFQKQENMQHENNYDKRQKNVCLMGACLIYSRKYIKSKKKIFYPETFLYYEEFIQADWCMKNNKMVVYSPDLYVYHLEGSATNSIDSNDKQRNKNKIKNTIKAAKIYREKSLISTK